VSDDKIDVDAIIGPVLGILGEQGPIATNYSGPKCWNHAPMVDAVNRTVTCKKCGAGLDPIDVLAKIAHANANADYQRNERRQLAEQVEQLKAEEKRVRARTKSHRNKDARGAVADEKRKQLARCLELKERTEEARRALERIDKLAELIATTPVDTVGKA
jgi:hypothetical protein